MEGLWVLTDPSATGMRARLVCARARSCRAEVRRVIVPAALAELHDAAAIFFFFFFFFFSVPRGVRAWSRPLFWPIQRLGPYSEAHRRRYLPRRFPL